MHVDLDYAPGTDSQCNLPMCCREENGIPEDPKDAAGYWGSHGKCDVPFHTMVKAVEFIREKIEADMIIWTGDNVPHEIWDQSLEHNLKATLELTKMFKKEVPHIPLYPIHGNHEYFPANL